MSQMQAPGRQQSSLEQSSLNCNFHNYVSKLGDWGLKVYYSKKIIYSLLLACLLLFFCLFFLKVKMYSRSHTEQLVKQDMDTTTLFANMKLN